MNAATEWEPHYVVSARRKQREYAERFGPVPLCACGCGDPVKIAHDWTPRRFLNGHGSKLRKAERGGSSVEERISNGLCPKCGEEAAPYLLCYACRQSARIKRALDRMIRTGHLKEVGGGIYRTEKELDDRWGTPLHGDPEKDRRFAPKLDGIPVNVEAKIMELIAGMGWGCSVDDVVKAWGRLRGEKRKRGSAAADVRAILAADERRRKRAEKRLAHAR